jgi:hypothetical protein
MSIKSDMEKKLRYNSDASYYRVLNTLDNWDQDQFFYARRNEKGRTIVPFDISTMTQLSDTKICFNFVADAFNDLKEHYREKVNNGLLPYADLRTLKVEKAYIKPLSLYFEHQKRMETIFLDKYLIPSRSNVKGFEGVLQQFDRFLTDYAHRYPITYSSFVNSSLCPMHGTALLIDLKSAGHNDDDERRNLMDHPSFYFFADLVKEYGFVVPKHAPWCIVANLDSRIMINYAIQYDALDKKQVLDEYFYECKDNDIDLLQGFLLNSYESFLKEVPAISETRICKNGRLKTTSEFRIRQDPGQILSGYSSSFWFRKYIEILLKEQRTKISTSKLDSLFKECYYMLEKYNFERAFSYAEMKILKRRIDRIR